MVPRSRRNACDGEIYVCNYVVYPLQVSNHWVMLIINVILVSIVFSFFFACPSIYKYTAKKTSISSSTKQVDFVTSPAITLIPGWRGYHQAKDCAKVTDLYGCLRNISYNIWGVIKEESHNGTWISELNDPIPGTYFTKRSFFNMSSKYHESYRLIMNKNLADISIVLHDPNYFISTSNPTTIPRLLLQGQLDEPFVRRVYIKVTKVEKMNMPLNPCNVDPTYVYTKCVKDFAIKV